MQDQEPDLSFRFIPHSPTKEAWDNRPFKHDFRTPEELFIALKQKEKSLGTFKYIDGYIYFKEGQYSIHKDGTEGQSYHNPRWWKTGKLSCWRKCCTQAPEGAVFDNSEPEIIIPKPYQKTYQEFRRIRGCDGFEEQFKEIPNKLSIARIHLKNIGTFFVENR